MRMTPEERFWSKVEKTESCWLWKGGTTARGYGQFYLDKSLLAHRFSYTLLVGPIPDGLLFDHTCQVKTCVRPDHLTPLKARPLFDRVMAKIVISENGCWMWTGHIHPSGYGYVVRGIGSSQRLSRVHRVTYEHFRGPIPDGLVLDHLCRVRSCANPDHLEAVTNRVNVLRGYSLQAVNAAKADCIHGHPLLGDNVMWIGPLKSWRVCLTCRRAYQSRLSANKKSIALSARS